MWKVRDGVIKREYAKADYQEGDLVRPKDDAQFQEVGWMRVRGIIKSYREWPKGEKFPEPGKLPFIVLAECLDKPTAFNCTVNYLRKATPEELEARDLKIYCEAQSKTGEKKDE